MQSEGIERANRRRIDTALPWDISIMALALDGASGVGPDRAICRFSDPLVNFDELLKKFAGAPKCCATVSTIWGYLIEAVFPAARTALPQACANSLSGYDSPGIVASFLASSLSKTRPKSQASVAASNLVFIAAASGRCCTSRAQPSASTDICPSLRACRAISVAVPPLVKPMLGVPNQPKPKRPTRTNPASIPWKSRMRDFSSVYSLRAFGIGMTETFLVRERRDSSHNLK